MEAKIASSSLLKAEYFLSAAVNVFKKKAIRLPSLASLGGLSKLGPYCYVGSIHCKPGLGKLGWMLQQSRSSKCGLGLLEISCAVCAPNDGLQLSCSSDGGVKRCEDLGKLRNESLVVVQHAQEPLQANLGGGGGELLQVSDSGR